MHSYLRAVGFKDMNTRTQLLEMLQSVQSSYDEKLVVRRSKDSTYAEFYRYFAEGMGVAVCGEYDRNNIFHREQYFPFYRGGNVSTQDAVIIEKHSGRESYAGVLEEIQIGAPLIFYLQNAGEYLRMTDKDYLTDVSVSMSGLASEGKILLPVKKDMTLVRQDIEMSRVRNMLMAEAKDGDRDALESLTLDDIDMYASISRRIQKEDVYSIVETFLIPHGVECDLYYLMGEIVRCELVRNKFTGQKVWCMEMLINDLNIDVCINVEDLLGEPLPGRRFKGIVWMQGYLNF